jgi:hypothetical protein
MIEHEFYNLDEAAKLLECKVQDLLKWGMSGKIELWFLYRGQLDRFSIPDDAFKGRPAPKEDETVHEFLPILKKDLELFILPYRGRTIEMIEIEKIMWPGCDQPLYLSYFNIFNEISKTQLIQITKKDLHIMGKTFQTLKAELRTSPMELGAPPPLEDGIADVLNPDHPWHSELLAIAIKGWMELYSNREGNSSDNSYAPTGGHKGMIRKWLSDQKSPLLTPTSIEELAKAINPCKSGGPSKTQR